MMEPIVMISGTTDVKHVLLGRDRKLGWITSCQIELEFGTVGTNVVWHIDAGEPTCKTCSHCDKCGEGEGVKKFLTTLGALSDKTPAHLVGKSAYVCGNCLPMTAEEDENLDMLADMFGIS